MNEFQIRVRNRRWPIHMFTGNRYRLQIGDNVIFYMAGTKGRKFLGSGRLASGLNSDGMDFSVDLSDINVWKRPLPMTTVLDHLKFVVNKTNWGRYFQGGVIRLPDNDFKYIRSLKS